VPEATPTSRGRVKRLVLMIVFGVGCLGVVSCSSTTDTPRGSLSPAGGATTYSNAEQGFSIVHSPSFRLMQEGGEPWTLVLESSTASPGPQGHVVPSEQAFLRVIVRPMGPTMSPQEYAGKAKSLGRSVVSGLRRQGHDVVVDLAFQKTTLNGVPAIIGVFGDDGVENIEITLTDGRRQYVVTGAAGEESWNAVKGELIQALRSFRLLND